MEAHDAADDCHLQHSAPFESWSSMMVLVFADDVVTVTLVKFAIVFDLFFELASWKFSVVSGNNHFSMNH